MNLIEDTGPVFRRFVLRIAVLLAVVGGAAFAYKIVSDRSALEEAMLIRARAHFRDIVLTRKWNAAYGGVYVEKKAGVESNPYLKDPDIAAANGKTYTLRNPALMTREISELAEKDGDYRFHITSLKLRNRNNAPDDWERQALQAFEKGERERFSQIQGSGRAEYRYMAPLLIEASCLKCHRDQDYQIGDVRGGISVRFDITPLLETHHREAAIIGGVVLLMLGVMFGLARGFATRFNDRIRSLLTRYDGLVQSVDGIVWEADASTFRFTFVSRQAERLLGFPVAEWRAPGFWVTHLHPADRAWALDHCASCASRMEPCDLEFRVIAQDGRIVWLRNLVNVVAEEGKPRYLRGLMFDISAQKDLEERLRSAIREQETIFQNAMVGIAHLRKRQIVSCNRRLEEIFGYGPGEMVGLSTEVLYAGPESFERLSNAARTALAVGSSYTEEIEMRRRNGEIFLGAIHGRAIDPANAGEGSIWIFADVSERKRIEQELTDYRQHLEELVRQRTDDLASALEAAQVADKTKDAFLANISHELRTPLNGVIGLSDLALRASPDPKQRDMLEKIADSGQTLLAIINDLLDLTKITAGEMRFENIPFSIRRVLARVGSAMSHRAAEKDLTLEQSVADGVPDVLIGDPLRVEQILNNLVGNAIKFTEHGHVAVRIVADGADGEMLPIRLLVEDTGVGMSEEELGRIFRPFIQADASTTRRHGGTGLGLVICKRLADAMGGGIEVSSQPGRGTCFTVTIRLARAAPGAVIEGVRRPANDPAAARYPTARVLVVDDQPINREVVAEQLALLEIAPRLAENGREAVDKVAQAGPGGFDLVLMDIQMPVLDGVEATRQIRSMPGMASLPIIAMTAHTMTHEKETYLAAGMNDHLGKPFRTAEFYALIARWLGAAGGQNETQAVASGTVRLSDAGESVVPVPPVARSSDPDLMAVPGLDALSALERFVGNRERYCHWLLAFVNDAAVFAGGVAATLARGEGDAARREVHAFKGRVGMLGMVELHRLAASLEAAIASSGPVDDLLGQLAHAVVAMRAALAGALNAPLTSAAPALVPKPPAGPMPASIIQLLALLEAADGGSISVFEACLAQPVGSPWAPVLRAALPLVRRFDFESACALLRGEERADRKETEGAS